jgi:hypothetical protein
MTIMDCLPPCFSDNDEDDDTAELETDAEDRGSTRVPSPDWILDEACDEEAQGTVLCLAESLLGQAVYYSFHPDHRHVVQNVTECLWEKSRQTKIPCTAQLETVIAVECNGKDVIHKAAMGSGKTITMGILMLLHPNTIFITVSPLNELHAFQVQAQCFWVWPVAQMQDRSMIHKAFFFVRTETYLII